MEMFVICSALLCASAGQVALGLAYKQSQQQRPLRLGGNQAATFASNGASSAAVVQDGSRKVNIDPVSNGLQDRVTWDEHTIFVDGERVLFYSGEYHPFRLPVADLYLDVFQKIRSMGYRGVSFYVDWALLEGKRGDFRAEGIFDLVPFFKAAQEAGIYLLARPGPYINAEVSGGGFPGWVQTVEGYLRTSDQSFIDATQYYITQISEIINQNDILHGGPIILFQPENEYRGGDNGGYFAEVRDQFLAAGIKVPLINNDVGADGNQAPGTPGGVDIYGHDGYPMGFDCANPYTWPEGQLESYMGNWHNAHLQQSPNTPYSIIEFQGGSFDPWGGPGFSACEILLNMEFERVFYKENFSFGVSIFNIYMTFGGTNWGNLGHPGGYTSYDYAAVVRENRGVDREKYSAAKLLAQSLQASPAYWTATPGRASNGTYATSEVTVTPLHDVDGGSGTRFFVVRHSDYNSLDTTEYKLTVPSSQGDITIPQLNGSLSLIGRDSKIHVVDYDVGGTNLFYSSAEVFTWKNYSSYTTLVVYGAEDELHEMAFTTSDAPEVLSGSGITIAERNGNYILNFQNEQSDDARVVKVGSLYVYIVDRNAAYNYWVLPTGDSSVIAKAGYLMRTASVNDGTLALTGDLNATMPLEIIGAPSFSEVTFNGNAIDVTRNDQTGAYSGTLEYTKPSIQLPNFKSQSWKYLDTLPEIKSSYDDSAWTVADQTTTNNTHRKPFVTPTVLFASDYGYYYSSLIYRGHFTATGSAETLELWTEGGSAYGASVWLGDEFIGSFRGYDWADDYNSTFSLPAADEGSEQILTVLIDVTGLNQNWNVPLEEMKEPRGIIDYSISGVEKEAVTWKLTGNLHGEDYVDKVRGPTNEGALFAERQGFHQPHAPVENWTSVAGGPLTGLSEPGVGFYVTTFDLDMPDGYDIPLSFTFNNGTQRGGNGTVLAYRAQLWVNGYQFGKYVHNIGPQDAFPVPEGILNYHGENWIAVSLWALEEGGAKLTGFTLEPDMLVQSGRNAVSNSPMPSYEEREGAY